MFNQLYFGLYCVLCGFIMFYQYNTYRYLGWVEKTFAATVGSIAVGIGCWYLWEFGRVITG